MYKRLLRRQVSLVRLEARSGVRPFVIEDAGKYRHQPYYFGFLVHRNVLMARCVGGILRKRFQDLVSYVGFVFSLGRKVLRERDAFSLGCLFES
jgi:hypothetical protein